MKIKIIAPSSKSQNLPDLLKEAEIILSEKDIKLIYRTDLFSGHNLSFFAASDQIRIDDLKDALTSPEHSITWAARGGYGAANLLAEVSKVKPLANKILIGFSDITALHVLMNQYFKLPSIHGPVLSQFINKKYDFSIFESILSAKVQEYSVKPINNCIYNKIDSEVMGGNLTVLESMIGSDFHPEFSNKILLLEEINESPYRVHRSLMHLKNAHMLDKVKAIIFGDFIHSENCDLAIEHFCKHEVSVPCFRIQGIGHGDINDPIVLGANSSIENHILSVQSPFKKSKL